MTAPEGVVDGTGLPDAVVRVAHLTKYFPVRRTWGELLRHPFDRSKTPVLSDVSCEVKAAEFFGLLGPNGAGKTTFLKILATLVLPDSGEVRIGGFDVRRDGGAVRRLTSPCLATERSLLWRLTARENLAFYADLLGIPRAEIPARIDEALSAVELRDTGNKMAGQFSSGMMQRLLIARALLAHPRVLLLDEPTRSLDPVAAREFRRFLREELVARRRCAVILATHNAEEALELCDRVAVLDRGRLLSSGTAEELTRKYVGATYRLVTREARHYALQELIGRGVARVEAGDSGAGAGEGWEVVVLRLREGEPAAAEVLSHLVNSGMVISRFEAVAPSLADLISAVVAREQTTRVAPSARSSGAAEPAVIE